MRWSVGLPPTRLPPPKPPRRTLPGLVDRVPPRHDVVAAALAAKSGWELAAAWLTDSLEIAEVHVHPDFHGRGIGRSLVLGLAEGQPERTAVLSTQDAESRARRLYRGLGFADLLTGYSFPGTPVPYAVMGATLPLRPAAPTEGRSPSPSR